MIISVVGTVLDAAAVAKMVKPLVKAGRSFSEEKNLVLVQRELKEAGLDEDIQKKAIQALHEEKQIEILKTEKEVLESGGKEKVKTLGKAEDQLSHAGKNIPPLTAEELARVLEWQDARNKFLKEWRNVDFASLSVDLKNMLNRTINGIRKNLTPDDIAGAIKEKRGGQILKQDGNAFNHITEVNNAIKSLKNSTEELQKYLGKRPQNYSETELLLKYLSNLKSNIDNIYP